MDEKDKFFEPSLCAVDTKTKEGVVICTFDDGRVEEIPVDEFMKRTFKIARNPESGDA